MISGAPLNPKSIAVNTKYLPGFTEGATQLPNFAQLVLMNCQVAVCVRQICRHQLHFITLILVLPILPLRFEYQPKAIFSQVLRAVQDVLRIRGSTILSLTRHLSLPPLRSKSMTTRLLTAPSSLNLRIRATLLIVPTGNCSRSCSSVSSMQKPLSRYLCTSARAWSGSSKKLL